MKRLNGTDKHASGGCATDRTLPPAPAPARAWSGPAGEKYVLITGGCGFIGTNLAHRLAASGIRVLLYDSLTRPGVERNLRWLRSEHGGLVQVMVADIRNASALRPAVQQAGAVFHFAAQVAVTTSLVDPTDDFEVNAGGTLTLLEAIRAQDQPPPLVFTSTNKVYGSLADVKLRIHNDCYEPEDAELRKSGVDESRSLDFHSPYGCSKGTADQYVIDYARTFGLQTAVFRMSCIYGPHQFGTEDQGWVAHFLIRALRGEPITIYGDGMQVRDILFVDDLVNAFLLAQANIARISGRAFNMGGGPPNTISLLQLLDTIQRLTGRRPTTQSGPWRAADQRYYVSNTAAFRAATGWSPQVGAEQGLERLLHWLRESEVASTSRARPATIRMPAWEPRPLESVRGERRTRARHKESA